MTPSEIESFCVADLMTLEPIVVRETDSVAFAETVLRDFRITGVPVVDREARLVGIFSETDALFLKLPRIAQSVHGTAAELRVGDVMSHPALTVDAMTPISRAAAMMIEHSVHRLVVVDEAGRPTGVVTSMDYVGLVAELAGQARADA